MNLNVVVHPHAMHLVRDCPIEAATPEIVDKIHNIVLTDRRVNVRELVEATGISHGTISIFARTIGYEKAIGKMGVAFAHCEP